MSMSSAKNILPEKRGIMTYTIMAISSLIIVGFEKFKVL